MQIKNVKLKLGDRIRLTWSNQAPIRVDEGKLVAYEKAGGVSRIRMIFSDGVESCWFNAKHPCCSVQRIG